MSFLQNLNTHSLRTTRGFKLKQTSPISSPQPISNSVFPHSPSRIPDQYSSQVDLQHPRNSYQTPQQSPQQPYQTINLQNGGQGQNVTSHKDIRNFAEQTLGSQNALAQAVKLPEDEDLNEWLAVHVVDFYNQINMLYGAITEFCSPKTCPRMIATEEYEYLWQETNPSSNGIQSSPKRPISLPACEYTENLMNWIQGFFDNDNIFPSKMGAPFPQQFPSLVKTIFKRLFRIYAHIYCHHFHEICELGLQSHLNTSLKHYVLFSKEFGLIQQKDYGPLEDLVESMLQG
ncbi:DBF2 kinase activator protein Mob1p [[Candida] jaroonii]|uniref:DBF2 kinase activator protein Mob1p n=1 Tax=[Candida] jaroonii TaxID=467808 RepID=A0ACA9Y0Y5_9ASCO|nr:DBF2 kinase activator protein Mob1p [[Candida] jaroonii]